MAELKTKATQASVAKFIEKIGDEERRKDCLELVAIMKQATRYPPKLWGPSIVGFGSYHYKYESGHEGDSVLVGFASRKPDLTLYITTGTQRYPKLLARLGKYKTGGVCLYIRRLADVDTKILKQLIVTSVKDMKAAAVKTPSNATRAQRSRP